MDALETVFERLSDETHLVSFPVFCSWDIIKGEMWYNSRVITKEMLTRLWTQATGSIEGKIGYEGFVRIYEAVSSEAYRT
jgi:hypothetical protein